MTSDCYAILGVTPTAEDVVIGAAYRALMRHYHPDTNSDPKAQARAQEISAAYAVLRDPARRAEYDAERGAGGVLWAFDEPAEPPPPMRTAGLVTAVLAVVLVGAVWAWPRPPEDPRPETPAVTRSATANPAEAAARPEPPNVTVPALPSAPEPAAEHAVVPPDIGPLIAPPKPVQLARAEPLRAPAAAAPPPTPERAKPAATNAEPKPTGARPGADQRVATLDRMSAGFFSQSMVHASDAKKDLLLAARDRSAAERKACRSESCVADAFVREIRETSAIMEGRAEPAGK